MPGDAAATVDAGPERLVGRWRLRRRVCDRLAGGSGTVDGILELRPDGADLRWDETGVLVWDGRRVEVSRTYLLRPSDGGWWVLFADGRPFHPWTPGVPVTHPCAADLYRGLVRVDSAHRWRVLWDVTGPRKQQRILTRLSRAR